LHSLFYWYFELYYCSSCFSSSIFPEGCFESADGSDYEGRENQTWNGKTCQSWSSQYPHIHQYTSLPNNYCRNPDGEPRPWCYTTDPKKRWDFCNVPMCGNSFFLTLLCVLITMKKVDGFVDYEYRQHYFIWILVLHLANA
jgi:hypothetical protein